MSNESDNNFDLKYATLIKRRKCLEIDLINRSTTINLHPGFLQRFTML